MYEKEKEIEQERERERIIEIFKSMILSSPSSVDVKRKVTTAKHGHIQKQQQPPAPDEPTGILDGMCTMVTSRLVLDQPNSAIGCQDRPISCCSRVATITCLGSLCKSYSWDQTGDSCHRLSRHLEPKNTSQRSSVHDEGNC